MLHFNRAHVFYVRWRRKKKERKKYVVVRGTRRNFSHHRLARTIGMYGEKETNDARKRIPISICMQQVFLFFCSIETCLSVYTQYLNRWIFLTAHGIPNRIGWSSMWQRIESLKKIKTLMNFAITRNIIKITNYTWFGSRIKFKCVTNINLRVFCLTWYSLFDSTQE